MKITREMTIELNSELAAMGCSFRYDYIDDERNPKIIITLPSEKYVNSFIINVTREFYDWLELWFKTKGIDELFYNNDGSVIWSKSGWRE
jgi:hypothetical protein